MAKTVTTYVCSECGAASPKWIGKCPNGGGWNTYTEEFTAPEEGAKKPASSRQRPVRLSEIAEEKRRRIPSGNAEFDRVLGGGIVPASMVLIGGDPGIGKSTLLTEVAGHLSGEHKVLYVSAEESCAQIKMRCDRLGVKSDTLLVVNENCLENILEELNGVEFLIVDSIQAVYLEGLSSSAGSVGQVRECASRLMRAAKGMGVTVFIVGHVTKEGAIAGPKVLEHIMDTVLYFEGETQENYRLLRAVKNRFGSANEVGVFEMREEGLFGVRDYAGVFLSEGRGKSAGSIVTPFHAQENVARHRLQQDESDDRRRGEARGDELFQSGRLSERHERHQAERTVGRPRDFPVARLRGLRHSGGRADGGLRRSGADGGSARRQLCGGARFRMRQAGLLAGSAAPQQLQGGRKVQG